MNEKQVNVQRPFSGRGKKKLPERLTCTNMLKCPVRPSGRSLVGSPRTVMGSFSTCEEAALPSNHLDGAAGTVNLIWPSQLL